jgi:MFS family permease
MTVGLVVTITLFASEALAVATVMPKVADDLGRGGYGAAFSAFFLGSMVGVLLGGPSADRWGPARPFAVAATSFAVGLLVSGTAPVMAVLVAGRVLQGIGAGATTPVVYSVIGRAYPEEARVRMFAVISTAWVLPGVLGPALAGLVAEQAGWRAVFLGLLPFVAVAAGATLPSLAASSRGQDERRVSLLPRTVVVVALQALRLRPGLPAAVAIRGLLTCAFGGVDVFLPLAITAVRGRSVVFAALAVTLTTLVWTAGAWLADRLIARVGSRRLVRRGLALLAAGIGLETLLLARSVPLVAGLFGAAVAGLGIGLAYSPLSAIVLALAEPGREGSSSSVLSLFEYLGFAAGPGITGLLVGLGSGRGWSEARSLLAGWLVAAFLALVGVVAARRLPSVRSAAAPTGSGAGPPPLSSSAVSSLRGAATG